jgi:hypothetical protein
MNFNNKELIKMNMPLDQWLKEINHNEDYFREKHWKELNHQLKFVSYYIPNALYGGHENSDDLFKKHPNTISVINTYQSEGQTLPVFLFPIIYFNPSTGQLNPLKIATRYNFYDWAISVDSPVSISTNFFFLTDKGFVDRYEFIEKFDFKSHESNQKQFSLTVSDNHEAFMFFRLLGIYLKTYEKPKP